VFIWNPLRALSLCRHKTGVTRGQFPASTFQRKAGICRESI